MAELHLAPSIHDERGVALEAVLARHADLDPSLVMTNHIDTVEASALPAIAWGWDMLGPLWERMNTGQKKRDFLAQVHALQGLRGTPWAVITALGLLGWNASLTGAAVLYHNGFIQARNGFYARNTAPSGWYAWFLSILLGEAGYSAADHALVLEIGQYYGRLSGRLEQVTLNLGDLATSGGAAPSWSGVNELNTFGVSEDGITWETRGFGSVDVGPGNTATITWWLFNIDAIGMNINFLGLLEDDGTVYAQIERATIVKGADIALRGTWTITW